MPKTKNVKKADAAPARPLTKDQVEHRPDAEDTTVFEHKSDHTQTLRTNYYNSTNDRPVIITANDHDTDGLAEEFGLELSDAVPWDDAHKFHEVLKQKK